MKVALPLAATEENIKSGFPATEICPFNSLIFTDKDFKANYYADRPLASTSTQYVPIPDAPESAVLHSSTNVSHQSENLENSPEVAAATENSSSANATVENMPIVNAMILQLYKYTKFFNSSEFKNHLNILKYGCNSKKKK